jgi:hypothetical protein
VLGVDGHDLIFQARQDGSVLALDVEVGISSLALLGGLGSCRIRA